MATEYHATNQITHTDVGHKKFYLDIYAWKGRMLIFLTNCRVTVNDKKLLKLKL